MKLDIPEAVKLYNPAAEPVILEPVMVVKSAVEPVTVEPVTTVNNPNVPDKPVVPDTAAVLTEELNETTPAEIPILLPAAN